MDDQADRANRPYGDLPAVDGPGTRKGIRGALAAGALLAAIGITLVAGTIVGAVAHDRRLGHEPSSVAYPVEAEIRHRTQTSSNGAFDVGITYRSDDGVTRTGLVFLGSSAEKPDWKSGHMTVWVDRQDPTWVTSWSRTDGWSTAAGWLVAILIGIGAIAVLRGLLLLFRATRLRLILGAHPWHTMAGQVRFAGRHDFPKSVLVLGDGAERRLLLLTPTSMTAVRRSGLDVPHRLEVAGSATGRVVVRSGPWEPVFVGRPPRTRKAAAAWVTIIDRIEREESTPLPLADTRPPEPGPR